MSVVVVSLSKLETLLHSCNSNWRHFSEGLSSSGSPRKLKPVDCGSPYTASRVEEGLLSLNVHSEGTIHTVQLRKLPRSYSRGVRSLCGFLATIANAGLLSRLQITYPAHCSGPTAALTGGFLCVCRYLPRICGPLPAHFLYTIQNTILYVDLVGFATG